MRIKEATTAMIPAMGAIQNTRGLSYVREVRVCRGMYILNNAYVFCINIFPSVSSKALDEGANGRHAYSLEALTALGAFLS